MSKNFRNHPYLINYNHRDISFVNNEDVIVGIQTVYGLPILTVEEVQAIKECMKSYEKKIIAEEKQKNSTKNPNPISPLSKKPFFRMGDIEIGRPNLQIENILIKFKNDDIQSSQIKYLKYKLKYKHLQHNLIQ